MGWNTNIPAWQNNGVCLHYGRSNDIEIVVKRAGLTCLEACLTGMAAAYLHKRGVETLYRVSEFSASFTKASTIAKLLPFLRGLPVITRTFIYLPSYFFIVFEF